MVVRPVRVEIEKPAAVVSKITAGHGEWLRFPETIHGPSPFDRTQLCRFEVARNDTLKAAKAGRRQPAFDLWS